MRVERLELAGEGLLRAQVEELRRRLEARGPARPRRAGGRSRCCRGGSAW